MEENEIQEEVVNNYLKNMDYFEKNHNELYKKIKLFEVAIELNELKEKYTLEYKDYGFDILDINTNKLVYGDNLKKSNSDLLKSINFSPKENSFKTFYDAKYEDRILDIEKLLSINEANVATSNAPIVHYVNKNEKEHYNLNKIYSYIIFGTGLGSHIEEIQKKIDAKIFLVVEPSLEIFRLSLFTTKYYELSNTTTYLFSVAEEKEIFRKSFNTFYEISFFYNHYLKFSLVSKSCELYFEEVQSFLVSQSHFVYSYNRSLNNLKRTVQRLKEGYNFLNISENPSLSSLSKPVIILAAGPSLEKNIEFLKENQDRYIIVAIYVVVPYLEKNNIIPDIVTHFDEQNEDITTKKIKNFDLLKKTIFIFAANIDENLLCCFEKENVFLFQSVHEVKLGFGELTSPSIGEITYVLMLSLGAKDVSLLGLDMALGDNDKTHIDDHYSGLANHVVSDSDQKIFNLKRNIIEIKGNFREKVRTLAVYKLSVDHMNYFSKVFISNNLINVYNLSDGAYFENTIPTKIKDIIKNDTFNKNIISKKLSKELLDNSSNNITDSEKIFINKKVEQANIYLKVILNIKARKFTNILDFKNIYFQILDEIIYKQSICNDLQGILLNYFKYNLTYIFHHFNTKGLSNPKKHMKYLNKTFCIQVEKIIKEYIEFYTKK